MKQPLITDSNSRKLEKLLEAVQNKKKIVNKLNELSGKEWIKFTKTWFIHRPAPRENAKLLHPAAFPESLAKEFIEFFTKRGQLVLDPFLGTGSTLIALQALHIGTSLREIILGKKKEKKEVLKQNTAKIQMI